MMASEVAAACSIRVGFIVSLLDCDTIISQSNEKIKGKVVK